MQGYREETLTAAGCSVASVPEAHRRNEPKVAKLSIVRPEYILTIPNWKRILKSLDNLRAPSAKIFAGYHVLLLI